MQFPGYWVEDDNGRVAIHITTFDDTELDPQTDWKETLQNQDADAPLKGFVETGQALAHAARLIARNQGREVFDGEILALQNTPSLFKDGTCELHNLEDFRLLCMLFNSLQGMRPKAADKPPITLSDAVDEIPFD